MATYLSSFTTGFQNLISKNLPKILPGSRIKTILDGAVLYDYNGNWKDIKKIFFLNNTFRVIKLFSGKQLSFSNMVNQTINTRNPYFVEANSFRVKFSLKNQFISVDKRLSINSENYIYSHSKMKINRLNPDTEFWYIIRSENIGIFGQLLYKRTFTEKNLNKGELRPEFAYLMCLFARLNYNEIICDPFAGSGAIPRQVVSNFKFKKLLISDLDSQCVNKISNTNQFKNNSKIVINKEDALELSSIENNSIDVIITDPPWGYYEQIDDINLFYKKMLQSFKKKIKKDGRIVILSARKEELLQAVKSENFIVLDKIDTLVNGKKAGLFYIVSGDNEKI